MVYEAVINDNGTDTYDPVARITIELENGFNYSLKPEDVKKIIIREKKYE